MNAPMQVTRVLALLFPALLPAGSRPLAAQDAASSAPWPAAVEDVASVDAIIAAVYDAISGPAGEARDWDRFRSLFVPGARLIPTGRNPEGEEVLRVQTVEEWIARAAPGLEERGFYERELHRVSESYGSIVHAFSTYDSRATEGEEPFARGINSFQLWNDGERWWVVTVLWDSEADGTPIPERYLPDGG